jgi:hypothetical protein
LIILTKRLQLAVASGDWIEKALCEFQGAEPGLADGIDPKSFPLGHEDLIPVIVEVVSDDRASTDILGEGLENLTGRISIPIEDLARVAMDAARLGRDFLSVVEESAEGCPVPFPTVHPLGGELDGEDRLLEAGRFGVEEDPGRIPHG